MPKFGPEFWVRLKHPNSRINQYQPGMNLYQIGMNLYHIGINLYQIGINSYRFRFSYTVAPDCEASVGDLRVREVVVYVLSPLVTSY